MFGYIRTHRPELKVCEDEAYRGVYCSLCRELGKSYGIMSRLFLSYDSTFLAVALMALSEKKLRFERKRCPFNPMKKCQICDERQDEIIYAADISVLLVYYKILDNVRDSTIFKAIAFRILSILMVRSFKKAAKRRPKAAEIIKIYIDEQKSTEDRLTKSIDEASEPTAKMLARIYSDGDEDNDRRIVRYTLGYNIGRWVYLIDAFDDMEKDRKSGSYNPFILSGRTDPDTIKGDLLMTAGEAAKAYEMLDIKKLGGICRNIVYDGLYYQTMKIYDGRLRNGQSV